MDEQQIERIVKLERAFQVQQQQMERLYVSLEALTGGLEQSDRQFSTHGARIAALWRGLRELTDVILNASEERPVEVTPEHQDRTRAAIKELERLFGLEGGAQ